MTPRQEYLKRVSNAGLLQLSSLHHHVMDRIFVDFSDGFSFDDVFQKNVAEPIIVDDVAMAGNIGRVKLVVIRALDGLVAVGLLRESASDQKRYHFCWTPPT